MLQIAFLYIDYLRRHLACEEDRGEVAIALVEHGASLDALNKVNGLTVYA